MTTVEIGVDYEGSKVIGVFNTHEVAVMFIQAHCKTKYANWHDYYTTTTFDNDGVSVLNRMSFHMDGSPL